MIFPSVFTNNLNYDTNDKRASADRVKVNELLLKISKF